MSKKVIHSDRVPAAIGPYSQAIQAGDYVFLSGQLGMDYTTGELVAEDVESQLHQVIRNIIAVLESAGLDLTNVVKTTIFLTDLENDYSKVNKIYAQYFSDSVPARSAVGVAKLPKNGKVEIELIAFCG